MAEEAKVVIEMTQAGYKEKVDRLNNLKNEIKREISEQIKYAKSLGDFSENAELDAAKERDFKADKEIAELEYEIANAKIIEARVYLIYDEDEDKGFRYRKLELVGDSESDVLAGKICRQAPLAQELIKHAKGAEFSINGFKYKVIEDNEKKITKKMIDELNASDKD